MRVALCLVVTSLVTVPLAIASRVGPEPYRRPHVVLQWEQNRALNAALRRGEPIYCGGGRANVVALTFDDGPGPYTDRLLELLRRAGAHATFFVIGNRLRYWPDAPHAESQLGAIGNHTWSHARLTQMPTWLVWAELLRTLAADLVPERPGRREPRAVKRKKNKYPRLNVARHKFRDHPKRNVRQKNARLRRLGLM